MKEGLQKYNGYNANKKHVALFIILSIIFCAFCCLKVLRGADKENTAEGGIWNYISILYYPLLFFVLLTKGKFKVKPICVISLFYTLFTMIAIFSSKQTFTLDVPTVYLILMVPYPLLVFVTFYLITQRSKFGENLIVLTYLFCLAVNLFTIVKYQFSNSLRPLASDIYYSLGLFSFALLFIKRKWLKIGVAILQFLAIFLANKRTGFIGFVIGIILYFIISSSQAKNYKFLKMFLTILFVALLAYVLYEVSKFLDETYNLRIYSRLNRIEEDGGSGRDVHYQLTWEAYLNSSFVEKVFGHGLNAVGDSLSFEHTHNDFLEILYNYGLFSFISIVLFCVCLISQSISLIWAKSPYAPAFAYALVVGLMLSMFSFFFNFYTYVTCIVAFWGYVYAMEKKRKEKLAFGLKSIRGAK